MTDTEIQYEVIRSGRKTVSLQIWPGGRILVRAPRSWSDAAVRRFVREKEPWIRKKLEEIRLRAPEEEPAKRLSAEEMKALEEQARAVIPGRVAYYAPLVGVTYGRVTIRSQKTRWGSCSSSGNLNFNCLLMLAPPEVLDSVVVHELCHRLEMNHSKRFYENVLRVYPEYRKWHGWLKERGAWLMARRP